MKIIVGLGNPGRDYVLTRHNAGFETVNLYAQKKGFGFNSKGRTMLVSENNLNGEKIILLKPLTYMNLSGQAVASLLGTYRADAKDILVVYDDMDLPCGKIRARSKGSAGGHNGIKSIISCIGTQDFSRIRLGIGKNENAVDFVLGKFSQNERKIMAETYELACDAIDDWIDRGIEFVMNKYNGL